MTRYPKTSIQLFKQFFTSFSNIYFLTSSLKLFCFRSVQTPVTSGNGKIVPERGRTSTKSYQLKFVPVCRRTRISSSDSEQNIRVFSYQNIVERLKDELAFLQGKVNDECKVKIREFQMLQTRFSKMSTFEPPQIYAAVMEEDDDPVK